MIASLRCSGLSGLRKHGRKKGDEARDIPDVPDPSHVRGSTYLPRRHMVQKDPPQPETLAYASRAINAAPRPIAGGALMALGTCALLLAVASLSPGVGGLLYLFSSGLPHDLLLPTFAWLAIAVTGFWAGVRWLRAGYRTWRGK